jgi:hypothetical protein
LQDKLIFSLRHAHELKVKPEQFGEGVFDKIFDIAKIASFNKEERAIYEANMMNKLDQYAALKCANEEGETRGVEKGREEVFALMDKGYSSAEIKKVLAKKQ